MGLFDINDEKLQALYHRALVEANYGFVNPRKYPYLDLQLCNMQERMVAVMTRH